MKRIYRIEHVGTKRGPYRCYDDMEYVASLRFRNLANRMSAVHAEPTHPVPTYGSFLQCTPPNKSTRDSVCGFASPTDMKEWFGPFLSDLKSLDFKVAVYKVPDHHFVETDRQVVFFRGNKSAEYREIE